MTTVQRHLRKGEEDLDQNLQIQRKTDEIELRTGVNSTKMTMTTRELGSRNTQNMRLASLT